MTTSEAWLPVRDYAGIYEVSDLGRVRSLSRRVEMPDGNPKLIAGRIRKFTNLPSGYKQLQMFRAGSCEARLVHRIVLEAFVGPCPDGMEACHGEGGNSDNRLTNLRWGTHRENVNESIVGGKHFGAKTHCPYGHPYEGDNLYIKPDGGRACRECRRNRDANRHVSGQPLKCAVCQGAIVRTGQSGRPPKWCGDQCRRESHNQKMRARYAQR